MHEVLDANYTWRRISRIWGFAIKKTDFQQSSKDILLTKSMKTTKKSSVKEIQKQAVECVGYNWHYEVVLVRGVNARISRKGSLSA